MSLANLFSEVTMRVRNIETRSVFYFDEDDNDTLREASVLDVFDFNKGQCEKDACSNSMEILEGSLTDQIGSNTTSNRYYVY